MTFGQSLGIDRFNRLPDTDGVHMLLDVCRSTRWAQLLVASRPYADADELHGTAARILIELPDAEIDAAAGAHARIGGPTDNPSCEREQAGVADASASVRRQLDEANQAYEAAFGHIYLVFASGRSADELLAILNERLHNDPATERRIMVAELGKINQLRLDNLLADLAEAP